MLALLDALPEDSPFLHLDPPQRRQRILAALQRLLLRDSQVQPLLLVFEDLHWIDTETQALLDSLVERLPTAQLLLLVNYRPEYQHGWGSKTYYTQLRLDPLPPASAAEVLQALLGDDPSLVPLKPLLIARTEGHPFFLWSGLLSRRQGDASTAISVLARGLSLYQTADIPLFFPLIASSLGAAYALAGRAAEARPLCDQVLERIATGSGMAFHALVLTELSEALLLVGCVDEADTLAGRLLDLSRTHTGRGYQAHTYRLLGEVARRRQPPDVNQAATYYRQALALAEELGMRPLQAHCHLGLGTLYARTGQRQQGQAALSAAIDLYRTTHMTFWLSQAEAVLAQTA